MILKLCVVDDGDNVVNKVLTNVLDIDVNLKKDFDIDNPVFYLTGDDYTTFLNYNYCVLVDLNRNYFINSIEQVNSRVVKLNCSCDVLETYKNDFLNSHSRFYRNIKTGDYFNGELELSTKKTITKTFSDKSLDDGSQMVLITVEG